MISISNVSKSYAKHDAVKNVSFTVSEGSICGLLGPNGAGKTTLLKIIAGAYHADAGSVTINGNDIFVTEDAKKDCLFVSDIPQFMPGYTIQQMARFFKSVYANWSDERFEELSSHFKMDTNKKISELSKGMQRQVSFWLAFSIKPKVLLLDEPMDGLDSVMRKQIRELIIHEVVNENLTVLISSHNLRELEDFCDAIVMLNEGECIIKKDLDDLKMSYQKIQIVFSGEQEETFVNLFKPIVFEKRGSFVSCVVKGNVEEIESNLQKLNPTFSEIIPLTLEEVFIHEMEVNGYGV